ncbi:MAG: hypothetical protein NVSMB63_11960 [Sediminibacterium sp.]
METEQLISVHELCRHHEIEFSFIDALQEFGLIETRTVETTRYIDAAQLKDLEKMIRLHYELDINVAGIDAISHLLNRIDDLCRQLTAIKSRLRLYESG